MAIDFTLTAEQKTLQLHGAASSPRKYSNPWSRKSRRGARSAESFPAWFKPAYVRGLQARLRHGPDSERSTEAAVFRTSTCSSSLRKSARWIPGFACILLVNGLALMPVVWFAIGRAEEEVAGRGDERPQSRVHRRMVRERARRHPRRNRRLRSPGPASGRPRNHSRGMTGPTASTSSTDASTGPPAPPAGISRAPTSTRSPCAPTRRRAAARA